MIKISKKHLIIISAIVWYSGSISLAIKSLSLFNNAYDIYSNNAVIIIALLTGIIIGLIKGKYIFVKSCKKNIFRINNLQNIKLWLFFKPSFMIALAVMITTGSLLSKWAEGNYYSLIAVAILDLTISVALFYSSFAFWKKEL